MNKSILMDTEYKEWLLQLKKRYQQCQIKAAIKVNSELIAFNWEFGHDIVEKQAKANWGDGLITQISKDMHSEFPGVKGFSVANINFCKRFYLFYSQANTIHYQVGSELIKLLSSIPWRHHIEIMTKCKDVNEALFYISKTVSNGWSRSVLIHFMAEGLFASEGRAITNFENTLPLKQSELAQQVIKDPYIFDFLEMTEDYKEKDLENALTKNIIKFLLELGSGFALVGQQYPIEVGGESFRIDLLFYHLQLRCYIVVELKTGKFEPEYAGKVGFYIAAVDNNVRQKMDNPTIGLIICKDKNDVVVRYALQNISQPLGVSKYQLEKLLPKDYKDKLPSVEIVENELNTNNKKQ